MVRAFQTNRLRTTYELGGLWEISADGKKERIPVPGSWETHPMFRNFRGKAVYRKEIFTDEHTGLRFLFKGVSHTARVYFDGTEIASHYNAYTPFSAVVWDVSPGKHVITVEADNSFSEDSSLHIPNDYFTYGGIIRPVVVEEIEEAFIERLEVTPIIKEGKISAKVRAAVCVRDSEKNYAMSLSFEGREFNFEEVINKTGIYETEINCDNADLWEPDTPVLYHICCKLSAGGVCFDDLIERVGFRTVEVKGKEILLNGKPVFFKGFNRHEDHPLFGASLPFQAMTADIELMKETGANTVRTSHYPNDELFLDLCDEYGMLVWEENHARGLNEEQMRNPNFDRQCEDCIREMVQNHYNHPSIVIWGVLNECASWSEYGKICYEKQINQIRSLDSTRPVTYASCHFKKELCLGMADIVSFNIYSGWYDVRDTREFLDDINEWTSQNGGYEKPMIISEFGAGGIYGFRDTRRVKWSEERQMDILAENLDVYLHFDGVVGTLIWQFCDCLVSDEIFKERPKTRNNKGIFDEYRRPKLAAEVVRRAFKCTT